MGIMIPTREADHGYMAHHMFHKVVASKVFLETFVDLHWATCKTPNTTQRANLGPIY